MATKKAAKVKQRKVTNPDKWNLVNFRISREGRKRLTELACRHTRGNISKWLRVAAIQYRPKSSQTASK